MTAKLACLIAVAIVLNMTAYGQQPQAGSPSVTRHPGDVLHYQVKFEGGDADKITEARIGLRTESIPADQPGLTNGFQGSCTKSSPPQAHLFECQATIPNNAATGNYRVSNVAAIAGVLSKGYNEDFHVPLVPIENPQTFNPPTKVIVTPKP
jgi:hypothetical protein